MEKVQATGLRPGMVVLYAEQPHRVLAFQHRTPGKGNAVVQVKLRGILSGVQTETRLMSTDWMERLTIAGRRMQYLYKEGDSYVFMDVETFEQVAMPNELLETERPWLEEGREVTVEFVGDQVTGVALPKTIEVEVAGTEPGLKGATASASAKPATLTNGVVVRVPQFIETGERIRVDPVECRYVERVK